MRNIWLSICALWIYVLLMELRVDSEMSFQWVNIVLAIYFGYKFLELLFSKEEAKSQRNRS